jgi:hypothetical protein
LNDRGRISVQFTIEELPAECQDVDAQDEFIVISSGAFESDDLRVAQYGQSPVAPSTRPPYTGRLSLAACMCSLDQLHANRPDLRY